MNDIKTPEHHNVLVPVDFSDSSVNAAEFAVEVAKLFNDEIILVHVINDSPFSGIFSKSSDEKEALELAKEKLAELKAHILSKWPKAAVNTEVRNGKIFKVIEEMSQTKDVDTIVMGTNGVSGIEQFIGSTTSRLIRVAEVPVIVVKEKYERPQFDRIVLPIDLTRQSKQKLAWGIKIAKEYNSEIHIIMEVEKDKFLENKVKANLQMAKTALKKEGIKHVIKLLDDRAYPDHIGMDTIKYADEVNADLIMIMTQKEKGLSEMFLGSYAQQVVNNSSKVPVMCINPISIGKYSGTDGFY